MAGRPAERTKTVVSVRRDAPYVITGATRGIGRAAAEALASQGARLIVLARSPERGREVLDGIGVAQEPHEVVACDLSLLKSVRAAASEVTDRHERIAALINCAAVYTASRSITADGFETMFATNHLGPFLLTNVLLDRLRAAAPARIVTVTAPSSSEIDFDDLQGERSFRPLTAFGATKMANLAFTFELAARLETTVATANAVHPGVARTELMSEAPRAIKLLTSTMATSPQKAAARVVAAAVSPELEGVTGQLLKGVQPMKASSYARDPEVRRRLWDISEELLSQPS